MVSSRMLRRVALVRTDVSEEPSAFIRVTRIGELGTTLAVTSNRRTPLRFLQEPQGVTSQKTPFVIVLFYLIFVNTVIYYYVRWAPLSPQHGASSDCGWRDCLQQSRVAANILNNQPRTNDKGRSSGLGLDVGLRIPHSKEQACYEMS
jgi:hypothetical protein